MTTHKEGSSHSKTMHCSFCGKSQDEVQKITDGFVKKADAALVEKEKEIMEI